MTLYQMFDAAYPPANAYPGCQAVAGYLGGNTPHVWTVEEWQRFGNLVQFPIWTGYLESNAAQDAAECARLMHDFGWKPGADNRRAVILDEETQVDAAWVNTFASVIWDAGYQTFMYGSMATILNDPPKEGYLVADWNNVPLIPPYANVIGCQYRANIPWQTTQIDLSVISETMLIHGGEGSRK